MDKKETGFVKLQIPAGEGPLGAPVGTGGGQQGANTMSGVEEVNLRAG